MTKPSKGLSLYTEAEQKKLTTLHDRLHPVGWRMWGEFDGVGMLTIVTNGYQLVPGSDLWLEDYLTGTLTWRDIRTALQDKSTPYEVKRLADARRAKRRKRPDSTDGTPTRCVVPKPPSETAGAHCA